jgi:flagellar hook protein FlgE
MTFNTALSGIRAANTDLQVTGNNIANASTVGFKSARAEFGDVYASSFLGGGSNIPGSGVSVQNIRQAFTQGNLKFTQNELDLSVNGEGFFIVEKNGERLFTRAGTFGLDRDGFIVNGVGSVLQGFPADSAGNLSGLLSDLRINANSQPPRQTTGVDAAFNLDANQPVLQSIGTEFSTNGSGINEAQRGAVVPTTTTLNLGNIATPITFSGANRTTFTLTRTDPVTGANTSSVLAIDTGTASSPSGLANIINSENFDSVSPVNVEAYVDNATNQIRFRDLITGVPSTIAVTLNAGSSNANALTTAINAVNTAAGVAHPTAHSAGIPEVTNNYGSHTLVIQSPAGANVTYVSGIGAGADETASELSALAGVSATAVTNATLLATGFNNNGSFRLNGVTLTSTNVPDMVALRDEINALGSSSLFGISASLDAAGDLTITSSTGRDLEFAYGLAGGTATVQGSQGASQIVNDTANQVKIGGTVNIILDEGYSIVSSQPTVPVSGGSLFGSINVPNFFTPVPVNAFDPTDQRTYNHATSTTIYDSLGNTHVMRQFFVKQAYDATDPTTRPNHWRMYVQVDGQNVGDPDPTLLPPLNIQPTLAEFNVHFNPDGSLNTAITDAMLISNWTPLDSTGQPLGALAPLNVLQGGSIPVAEPPSSSNFEIDLAGSTQFGSVFAVEELDQNGYTTGRLAGLDVGNTGIIFARFTNGEALILGQVALANFASVDGLKPVGDTMWAETFETGEAVVGAPGSAQLGGISAGAVEESNVDLSEQLVNLIIAQRNYQANAKTIETANATTQTIINLR